MSVVQFKPKAAQEKERMLEFLDFLKGQIEDGTVEQLALVSLSQDGMMTFFPERGDLAQISVAARRLDADIVAAMGLDG